MIPLFILMIPCLLASLCKHGACYFEFEGRIGYSRVLGEANRQLPEIDIRWVILLQTILEKFRVRSPGGWHKCGARQLGWVQGIILNKSLSRRWGHFELSTRVPAGAMPPAVRSSPAASQNSFREVSKSSVAWLIYFDARKPRRAVRWRMVSLFSGPWWLEVKLFRRTQVQVASSPSDFEEKKMTPVLTSVCFSLSSHPEGILKSI